RGHIQRAAVRHMAVGPGGVLSTGRTRLVEQAGLREQHERPSGVRALPLRDLVERSSEMHSPGPPPLPAPPRNRSIERPVEFEGARSVSIARQRLTIRARKAIPGEVEHLAWGDIG